MAGGDAGAGPVMSQAEASDPSALNATAIVSTLNRHEVRFVVIGAFAAIAQGAPIAPTRDIDLTPDVAPDNLDRLSAALKELDARTRVGSSLTGLPFSHDGASLSRAAMWNLVCRYGEFDISFHPSGFDGGYAELAAHAHRVNVEGVELTVADLSDVIRSKESAGRPKDLRVLPELYRFRASREDDEPGVTVG
jgi:hypothetical protein